MSSPSDSLCKPGTGVFMPHTGTLQPNDSSKPQAATDASHTNNSRTTASRVACAQPSHSSSGSTINSSSSRAAGSGNRPQLLPSSATTGGRRSLDALIERQDAAASRGVHRSMSEGLGAPLDAAAPQSSRQAIGMHDTASHSLRLTCGVSPSAARRSGPYNSSTRSWSFPYAGVSSCQGSDMGLPAGSWMASGAQAGNAHSLPPQYRAAGSAGYCSSRLPALARASAASAAHGAGAAEVGGSSSSSAGCQLDMPPALRHGSAAAAGALPETQLAAEAGAAYQATRCRRSSFRLDNSPPQAAAAAGGLAQQLYEMQRAGGAVAGSGSFYAGAQQQGLAGSYDDGLLFTATAMQQQQQQQHQLEQEQQLRRHSYSCPLPSVADRQIAAMNSMNALLAPVSEEVYAAAAAAQRGRLAVEAIDEELLMLLQAKEQLEAGRTALYGYSAACSAAPAALSAPLPGSPPQWEAPHDANGHLAAAQYHHDSQGKPCLQDITLQTYMELHQQQLAGHRLCMQTVSESCMLGGGLDAAAHAKLRRLMELQRMQLELQEKLLHSLASYNGNM